MILAKTYNKAKIICLTTKRIIIVQFRYQIDLLSLTLLKTKSKLRKRVVLDRKISRSKRCLTFLIREPYKMMMPPLIIEL
jgi:hypothetical protein